MVENITSWIGIFEVSCLLYTLNSQLISNKAQNKKHYNIYVDKIQIQKNF